MRFAFSVRNLVAMTAAFLAVEAAPSLDEAARADLFLLVDGGQIEGEWTNREQPSAPYVVRTELGVRLTLARSQVRELVRRRPAEVEYERRAPLHGDTVEEQWKLAEWCRQQALTRQREHHLRRIVELDDTATAAWRALGYSQVGGRWVAKDELKRAQGLEFFQGRWRLPQEIRLLEETAAVQQSERDWQTKLKRWRLAALEGERPTQARSEIREIRDPLAVRALAQLLAVEPNPALRLLYVETLGRIASSTACDALVAASLQHRDVEVVHACVEEIVRIHPPGIVDLYTRTLNDSNNERVNRAALTLGRLGDKSAIGALIQALVTTHKVVTPGKGNPEAMSASFGKTTDGSGNTVSSGPSFSRPEGPKVRYVRTANQEVLHALGRLVGDASFGFDQQAWKNWYGLQKHRLAPIDARRDVR